MWLLNTVIAVLMLEGAYSVVATGIEVVWSMSMGFDVGRCQLCCCATSGGGTSGSKLTCALGSLWSWVETEQGLRYAAMMIPQRQMAL